MSIADMSIAELIAANQKEYEVTIDGDKRTTTVKAPDAHEAAELGWQWARNLDWQHNHDVAVRVRNVLNDQDTDVRFGLVRKY